MSSHLGLDKWNELPKIIPCTWWWCTTYSSANGYVIPIPKERWWHLQRYRKPVMHLIDKGERVVIYRCEYCDYLQQYEIELDKYCETNTERYWKARIDCHSKQGGALQQFKILTGGHHDRGMATQLA